MITHWLAKALTCIIAYFILGSSPLIAEYSTSYGAFYVEYENGSSDSMYIPIEGLHDMPDATNLAEWFRTKFDTVVNAACQHEVLNAYSSQGEKVFHPKYNHYLHTFKSFDFSEIEVIRIGRVFEVSIIYEVEYLDPARNDSNIVLTTILVSHPRSLTYGRRNQFDFWDTYYIYVFEESDELTNQLERLVAESNRIDSIIEWIYLDLERKNIEYFDYNSHDTVDDVEPQFQSYHEAIKDQTSKLLELLESIKKYHVAMVRDSDV